jgi:hypothetical protein
MTPIYDALCAAPHRSAPTHVTDAVSDPAPLGRPELRLVQPPAPTPTAAAPSEPATFPARVLSTTRTQPWKAGLLP